MGPGSLPYRSSAIAHRSPSMASGIGSPNHRQQRITRLKVWFEHVKSTIYNAGSYGKLNSSFTGIFFSFSA
ncbi:hypothetical protein I312_101399 [Cryptococcus bacillisporus CA1280]|uniref:uncharacterized protein n=1 Tax=Cryptococcus bacillisporus CA1280 TaxID=1296109 RepID=UPI003369AC3A